MHPIIQKSAFRKGEYLAYTKGVQRIAGKPGNWYTYAYGSLAMHEFLSASAPTLHELGEKLQQLSTK